MKSSWCKKVPDPVRRKRATTTTSFTIPGR
jgi:hypothetical protein